MNIQIKNDFIMIIIINYLSSTWNQMIFWFHDASVKTNIRSLVKLSVWACDRLIWKPPEEWQLVNGIRLKEYLLLHELEVARHQIQFYANYAHELQCRILFLEEENSEKEENSAKELLSIL